LFANYGAVTLGAYVCVISEVNSEWCSGYTALAVEGSSCVLAEESTCCVSNWLAADAISVFERAGWADSCWNVSAALSDALATDKTEAGLTLEVTEDQSYRYTALASNCFAVSWAVATVSWSDVEARLNLALSVNHGHACASAVAVAVVIVEGTGARNNWACEVKLRLGTNSVGVRALTGTSKASGVRRDTRSCSRLRHETVATALNDVRCYWTCTRSTGWRVTFDDTDVAIEGAVTVANEGATRALRYTDVAAVLDAT